MLQQKHGILATRQQAGDGLGMLWLDGGATWDRRRQSRPGRSSPGGVGAHDQCGDLAEGAGVGPQGGSHGIDTILRQGGCRAAGLDPCRKIASKRVDVGGQRGVIAHVVLGVIANDVEQRRARLAGVVQIRDGIGQAGAKVQECRGRPARHAPVAIRRPAAHALEQRQHRTHAWYLVQRLHKMHLGGTRIGDAQVHAAAYEGFNEGAGAIHGWRLQF